MKQRFLIAFVLLLVPISSAQVYKITDLGSLSPTAINFWGQVVGNFDGQAFIWAQFAGPKGLGTLTGGISSYAAGINDLGAVTGTADGLGTVISRIPSFANQECSDLTQPFVWTPRNGMQGLGTVAGPDEAPWDSFVDWCTLLFYGTGINDSRQVVGYTSAWPDFYQWGFLWKNAGGMTTFGSSWTPTIINGVSNTGQSVGQTGILIGNATSWKSGAMTSLEDLSGGSDSLYSSSANGVNDRGQVVGWSTTVPIIPGCESDLTGCPMHAVRWTASGVIQDLGTLPGDTYSTASNINFFGQIIGSSGNTLGSQAAGATGGAGFEGSVPIAVVGRPFIWSARAGMQDLNTLISANSGWVLDSVAGINIWGQIVGSGTLNGQAHGFLLTPKVF
jgi:uncharacterized membrane protein